MGMKKYRLLTPGPTEIPERVLSRFSEPILHHRTKLFEDLFKEFSAQLKQLFQTEQEVLVLSSTGTGAMEASVANLLSANDEVIFVNAGKFGERWGSISKKYGLITHEVKVEWGSAVEVPLLEATLKQFPKSKAVLFQASETSTGVKHPVKEIVEFCKKNNVLSVCDGITAVGIFDLPMDSWGIDVLITGSQKALMLPPGLAFVAFSDRAWKAAEVSQLPKFYFDLKKEKEAQKKMQTAWTPAISLIQGGVEALRLILSEGLPQVYQRHEKLAQATRDAVQAMGLELFSKSPSPVLTTVKVPESIADGKQVQKIMLEKYRVVVMGGQDHYQGKIIRLSHFGYTDLFDVMNGIGALELALSELGYSLELGRGVTAVLKSARR